MPGHKSRNIGIDTEKRVWYDLLSKGYIASKWHNNVDLENDTMIIAKPGAFRRTTTGFPDFIYFKINEKREKEVIGLEVKTNGRLSRVEEDKCDWYNKKKVFSKIQIASRVKEKNRIEIVYKDYDKKKKIKRKNKDNDK